jgi:YesN/AraC family two-component response regulator
LLLNQHVRHETPPCDNDAIAFTFIILPQFFMTTLGMIGDEGGNLYRFLLSCLRNEDYASGYLHFKVADVPQIQCLIEGLLWALIGNVQYRRSVNQITMGLLFLHLLNHTDKASSGSKKDDLVFKILHYVEERYVDGTLGELAANLGYNMKWLSTAIKRMTGKPFKELQHDRRISQAKFLLNTTRLPITDIAKQVGYVNIGYFHRLFQARVGCSPGNYRSGNHLA